MKTIVGVFFSLFAGAANAILIDFDNLPGGGTLAPDSILTSQYSSLGVIFSATENGSIASSAVINTVLPFPFSGNYWANTTTGALGPRHDVLTIMFDDAVENVSWLTDSFGLLSVTFNAYDNASNLLETISTTGNWISTSFSSSGIYRIDVLQPTDQWVWGLDNLSFDVSASVPDPVSRVPEPASIALIGLGLAGIGFFRRRKST